MFARLYESGAPPEIDAATWRTYWCAATAYTATSFRACSGEGGYSILRPGGILALGLSAGAAAGIAFTLLWYRAASRPSAKQTNS